MNLRQTCLLHCSTLHHVSSPHDLSSAHAFHLVPAIDGATQMRDDDAAADDEADAHGFEYFVARDTFFAAPDDVIRDAIIAAQHEGSDQSQQFLGLHVERATFVGPSVEIEEPIDDEIVLAEDARVHALAELTEFGERGALIAAVRVRGTRCAVGHEVLQILQILGRSGCLTRNVQDVQNV